MRARPQLHSLLHAPAQRLTCPSGFPVRWAMTKPRLLLLALISHSSHLLQTKQRCLGENDISPIPTQDNRLRLPTWVGGLGGDWLTMAGLQVEGSASHTRARRLSAAASTIPINVSPSVAAALSLRSTPTLSHSTHGTNFSQATIGRVAVAKIGFRGRG